MMYKSFIPILIGNYRFNVEAPRLQELSELFNELNILLSALKEEDKLELIRMEANDSWRLADDKPFNPFSFASNPDNVNVDNIVNATIYAEDALEELPISTRLIRNIHYLLCAGDDYDRKYRGISKLDNLDWQTGTRSVGSDFRATCRRGYERGNNRS